MISLGGSCTVAYQLKKHGYLKEYLPFDWIRIKFIDIIECLETNFSRILDKNNYKFIEYSNKFHSKIGMSAIYKVNDIGFYHDFNDQDNMNEQFENHIVKYKRRVDRLYNYLKSLDKITFIRYDTKDIKMDELNRFNRVIQNINPNLIWTMKVIIHRKNKLNNKIISLDNNQIIILYEDNKIIDWKRDDINWLDIFT